jgi:uncharacterized protein DUF4365
MMEDLSKSLFQNVLPPEWVIHDYRPDYGIDLIVELFKFVDEEGTISETLAEMFFVQLKSMEKSQVHKVKASAIQRREAPAFNRHYSVS